MTILRRLVAPFRRPTTSTTPVEPASDESRDGVAPSGRQLYGTDREARLRELVASDDPLEVEAGRDLVSIGDIAVLTSLYWSTEKWDEKLNVIELSQDHCDPELIKVASDFLRAPVASGDDRGELAKAIALGHFGQEFDHHVDHEFDRYTDYANDRELLRRKVNEALELLGLEPEPLPPPPSPPPPSSEPLRGRPDDRLLAAAALGRADELGRALADRANPNAEVKEGDFATCSALIRACMTRHYELAITLVEAGARVNHRRTGPRPEERHKGQTATWWAAAHGRLDMIEYLAAAGADLDVPDSWGSTPLHQAASGGEREVAEYLLARGADPMARIHDGRTPLNMAATHGRTELVALLLAHGIPADVSGSAGYTALMLACEQGKIDMAAALIDAGADVDAKHPGQGIYSHLHRWTPLVFAVAGGRIKMTRFMIDAGADVNHEVVLPDDQRGEDLPARRVIEFCGGRQSARLREILVEAGSRGPLHAT